MSELTLQQWVTTGLLVAGDTSWMTDYEVVVPLTINKGVGNGGVGVAIGWTGHTGTTEQPLLGHPYQMLGWIENFPVSPKLAFLQNGDATVDETPFAATAGTRYLMKMRSESVGGGQSLTRMKVWEEGQPEPGTWDLNYTVTTRNGSVLLVAHLADVSFGPVTITPLTNTNLLTTNVVGGGSILRSPNLATYPESTVVELSAVPNPGWSFDNWSDGLSGNANPDSVTMLSDTTVTANFSQIPYTLSTNGVGSGAVQRTPDQPTYFYGDTVIVTAIPDPGWSFDSWTAGLSGSVNPDTVVVTGDSTVTATFTQDQYTLTLSTVGDGAAQKSPDQPSYLYGDTVVVTAIPDPGWTFANWSGGLTGSENPDTIIVQSDSSATANFSQNQYTVAVSATGDGSVQKTPDQPTYVYGDTVVVTPVADAGWSFDSWTAGLSGSQSPDTVVVQSDSTVTALFTQDQYTMTLNTAGNGAAQKSPDQPTYVYGDTVVVSAIPDPGWTFANWSGGLTGSENPDTIVVQSDSSATANFTQDQYTLTATATGDGAVQKSPDQPTYVYGDTVIVTPVPDPGWSFDSWTAGLAGSESPDTVIVQSDSTVTALFTQDQYALTLNTAGDGAAQKTPDQPTYVYGDTVIVSAIPDPGWTFANWSGGLTGSENPDTIIVQSDSSATANFTQDQYTIMLNTAGDGAAQKSPDQPTYVYGDTVIVSAIPDPGWTFANWSGGLAGSENPDTIIVESDSSATANFTQDQYTLAANAAGNGAVQKSPDQATYVYGDTVIVTPLPDPGWSFDSWTAGLGGSESPDTVIVQSDSTVTALFTQNQYTFAANATGDGAVQKSPNQPTYVYGDTVIVTAVPDPGWTFSSWSTGLSGSENPDTVVVQSDTTVTADFTQNAYVLTTGASGDGAVQKSPDQASYVYGDTVVVTAIPDPGWTFANWSGGLAGSENPDTIIVESDSSATANFTQDQYTLAANATGNGAVQKSPDQQTYLYGDTVIVTPVPDAGWSFDSWNAGLSGSESPDTVVVQSDSTVSALFTQDQYTLTATATGGGAVQRSPDQPSYVFGDTVVVTPVADAGWTFDSWTAGLSGNESPDTVIVQSDSTVTALFTQDQYTITLNAIGDGAAQKSPDQPTYLYGDTVVVTAIPDPGWTFANWSGGLAGSENPDTIVVQSDSSATANFTQDQYTLAANATGSGVVQKSPDQQTYLYGDTVIVTPVPDAGWSFDSWNAGLSGSESPDTVVVQSDSTVSALFTQDQYTITLNAVGDGAAQKSPDQATYLYGDTVVVTAIPDPGWTFLNWSGGLSGSVNPDTIIVQSDSSATANFTQDQYTLTANATGNGAVQKSPDQPSYVYGDTVIVTPVADVGWTFDSWTAGLSGNESPDTVIVQSDSTVTALFTQDQYTITLNAIGDGAAQKSPDQPTYLYGDTVVVTAIPDPGWTFLNWSGGLAGSENPDTIIVQSDSSATATFSQDQYSLTANVTGNGAVQKSPDQPTYLFGDTVIVTAVPDAGWTFVNWSGDLTGSENPDTVIIAGNATVTANFSQDQYTLTTNVAGDGTVQRSPDQPTYVYGDTVLVTALPDPGWTFANWSDGLTGSENPDTIIVQSDSLVTANFSQDAYILTANTVGNGSIQKSPDQGSYAFGDTVVLTAVPDPGWAFSVWSDGLAGSENPDTVIVSSDSTVTATFTQDVYTLSINTVGNGSVQKTPDQPTYSFGDTVFVTAVPDTGWSFDSWSAGLSGSENPDTLIMSSDSTVTATFTQDQYALNIDVDGSGTVGKFPNQPTYSLGDTVVVTADPDTSWTFAGWSGDLTSTENPDTIIIGGETNITATFGGPTAIGDLPPVDRLTVRQNYPNPFRNDTRVNFGLPRAAEVRITVYDVRGRRVYETTTNGAAGWNDWNFNGRNSSGDRLATGVYFMRMRASGQTVTHKMVIMR